MEYIRRRYAAPVFRGQRVAFTVNGERQEGTVTSAGKHLRVRPDGRTHERVRLHPLAVEYLSGQLPVFSGVQDDTE